MAKRNGDGITEIKKAEETNTKKYLLDDGTRRRKKKKKKGKRAANKTSGGRIWEKETIHISQYITIVISSYGAKKQHNMCVQNEIITRRGNMDVGYLQCVCWVEGQE